MSATAVVVLTLSPDELRALVVEAVRAVLTAQPAPTSSQRFTLDALAHAEDCSRATIRRLTRDGGPVHYLGASPRYDLAEWRAWCEARGRAATKAPARASVAGVRLLSRGSK